MYETITDKIDELEELIKKDESRIKIIHQDMLFNRGYVAALYDIRDQCCEVNDD